MRRLRVAALVAVRAWIVPAAADGIIIPFPRADIPGPPLRWLTTVYHRVTVSIVDGVATTRVDGAFRNDGKVPVEGTYVLPLPQGAAVQKFSLWVNGEPVVGGVLPADEARRIAPEYVEVLSPEGGLLRYRYPLAPERFSARPLEDVSVEVVVKANRPVGTVYSPTHSVTAPRDAPTSARAFYRESDVLPDRDFILYYSLAGEGVGSTSWPSSRPGRTGSSFSSSPRRLTASSLPFPRTSFS